MSNITQPDELEDRVTICFKANREFRVALDMVLARKQMTVQDFCFDAIGKAVAEAESASKPSPQSEPHRRKSA